MAAEVYRRWTFYPTDFVDVEGRRTEKLNYTTLAADGYSVFFWVAATLIDAFQQDISCVPRDDTTLVMAPMKLQRARGRTREETAKETVTAASLTLTQNLAGLG